MHRNVVRHHLENPIVLCRLNDHAEVFGLLLELRSDLATATFQMKNTQIPVLNYRTLLETVEMND